MRVIKGKHNQDEQFCYLFKPGRSGDVLRKCYDVLLLFWFVTYLPPL